MIASDEVDKFLNAPVTFRVRPVPIPCSLRPVYRISLLLLMIHQCQATKGTMLQLQVLNWAIRTPETRSRFLRYIHGTLAPNDIVVRFDPSLSRAVSFALGERVIQKPASLFTAEVAPQSVPLRLTEKGEAMVQRLKSKEFDDVFIVEKAFLESIGGKVSQKDVKSLFAKG